MHRGQIAARHRRVLPAAAATALAALFAACAAGGLGAADPALERIAAGWRAAHPWLVEAAIAVTQLGSGVVTLGLAAIAVLWLWQRGRLQAWVLLAGVLAVRLAVEAVKAGLARARPAFEPQLFHLHSYSFPSGHSANSMATYVLLAALLAGGGRRAWVIPAAVALALLIGATRVLLGVHWPSDVLGGWALGAIGVLAALGAERRLAAAEQ